MQPRWDGDTRGRGIGDAAQLVPGAGELFEAFGQPDWVAEDPQLHSNGYVLGELADGRFEPHGHVVVINLVGVL
jgi:hypothetical protein